MVENNDGGAVAPADDDARPDSGTSAPSSTQQPVDIDDLALQQAIEAAEAEERGDDKQAAKEPEPSTPEPEEGADLLPPEGGSGKQPGPVPYERFREVNKDLKETRDRLAYLEGQMDALKAVSGNAPPASAPPAANQAPPPASIPDQIKTLRAGLKEAAAAFDAGEISLAEFEDKRGAVEDTIANLNLQVVAELTARNSGPSLADETLLQAHAQTLNQEYPALMVIPKEELQALANMVMAQEARAGRPIGDTPQETMRLRTIVAKRAAPYAAAIGIEVSTSTAPSADKKDTSAAPLSAAAQARLKKMGVAADMPPDTSGMGSPGATDDPYSDARVARMTDDELAALPDATRRRILSR
jgi:hypothetical protein